MEVIFFTNWNTTMSRKMMSLLILALGLMLAVVGCAGSASTSASPTTAATIAPVTSTPVVAPTAATTTTMDAAACTKLDLNNLTEDQLLSSIPDFSNRMVREFFEYRPYVSIQQFRREIGKYVDEATVTMYEQYVYVPVDVNESDTDTLMQIPGIDTAIADALIAGRPYSDNTAFLTALSSQIDANTLAGAACYLAS